MISKDLSFTKKESYPEQEPVKYIPIEEKHLFSSSTDSESSINYSSSSEEEEEKLKNYMKNLNSQKKENPKIKITYKEKLIKNIKKKWTIGQEHFYNRLCLLDSNLTEDISFCNEILKIENENLTEEQRKTQKEINKLYDQLKQGYTTLNGIIFDTYKKRQVQTINLDEELEIPD
jgi:hypothetical protein